MGASQKAWLWRNDAFITLAQVGRQRYALIVIQGHDGLLKQEEQNKL